MLVMLRWSLFTAYLGTDVKYGVILSYEHHPALHYQDRRPILCVKLVLCKANLLYHAIRLLGFCFTETVVIHNKIPTAVYYSIDHTHFSSLPFQAFQHFHSNKDPEEWYALSTCLRHSTGGALTILITMEAV
jgi:hypothetical protein